MFAEAHFDRHQFAGRRARAVSATTGLSFSDFGSMHVERRVVQQIRRLPTPEWAINDASLRAVVMRFGEERLYIRDHSGTDQDRMARITAESQRQLRALRLDLERRLLTYNELASDPAKVAAIHARLYAAQVQNVDTQILILERGVVALATAVIYSYYRQGMKSTEVAEQFGLKSPQVRMWLYRMHTIANRLWAPELRVKNQDKTQQMQRRRLFWTGGKVDRLAALRASGKTFQACADALGLKRPQDAYRAWAKYVRDKG